MSQPPLNIIDVESVGDYRLRLRFDDGVVQTVDFFPFLAHSRHPDIRAYLDPARFAGYRLLHERTGASWASASGGEAEPYLGPRCSSSS